MKTIVKADKAYVFRSEDGDESEERQSIGVFPSHAVPRVGDLIVCDSAEVRVVIQVSWWVPNGNTDCIAMIDTDPLPDSVDE